MLSAVINYYLPASMFGVERERKPLRRGVTVIPILLVIWAQAYPHRDTQITVTAD